MGKIDRCGRISHCPVLVALSACRMTVAVAGSALIASAATGTANAASYTLTTSGLISDGTDGLGLFGTAGNDLTGDSYSLAVAFNTNAPNIVTPTFQQISGLIPGSVRATVDGVTTLVPVTTSLGALLQAFNNLGSSALLGQQTGTDNTTGQFVATTQEVFASTGAVTGPVLADTSYTVQAGDYAPVSFTTSLGFTTTNFDATASSINLAVVPEPASLLLLATGLLGLGAIRRRRSPTR